MQMHFPSREILLDFGINDQSIQLERSPNAGSKDGRGWRSCQQPCHSCHLGTLKVMLTAWRRIWANFLSSATKRAWPRFSTAPRMVDCCHVEMTVTSKWLGNPFSSRGGRFRHAGSGCRGLERGLPFGVPRQLTELLKKLHTQWNYV